MRRAAREELLRRLAARPDDRTGFDLTNIKRLLEASEEVATGGAWTLDGWERFAEAVERVSSTRLVERPGENGHSTWTHEDGSPLSEQYREDAQAIVAGAPNVVAEVERLRTLVEAAGLVLRADEERMMAVVVAGLELLAIDPCGHDPTEQLDEHCPSCRMRTALRGLGHGSDPGS